MLSPRKRNKNGQLSTPVNGGLRRRFQTPYLICYNREAPNTTDKGWVRQLENKNNGR